MSWLSDQMERRRRFEEKYPNGTQAEWIKFSMEEAIKSQEVDIEGTARNMVAHHIDGC